MRASHRFCFGCEVGRALDKERIDRPAPKFVRKCIVAAVEDR
jgi:hypothetical protein